MERLEERLNGIEERMLERITVDIEQRLIGRMTARYPRNESRQVRNGPGGRRNDVVLNEEAESHQHSDDDVDTGVEEPLYMQFDHDNDDEVNVDWNQAENP